MLTQESILVFVTIPSHINASQVSKRITEDHPFLQNIEIESENILKVRIENIADLLDLDFINSYGASDVKLNTYPSQSQISSLGPQNFDSFKFSENGLQGKPLLTKLSCSRNEDDFEPKKILKMERLTSLEDELLQDQKIKKYFQLLPSDDQDEPQWKKLEEQQEQKSSQTLETFELDQTKDRTKNEKKESMWVPVLSGVAMTAMMVGGYKAFSLLFNR